jgi:hypothetical protein
MNYIYASIYVVICVILFIVIFMSNETFNFLFEKKYNNITDYNHPEYTGGMTYEFNPYRHFTPLKI